MVSQLIPSKSLSHFVYLLFFFFKDRIKFKFIFLSFYPNKIKIFEKHLTTFSVDFLNLGFLASKTWLYTNYSKGKINLFLSTFAFMSWIISWRVSIFNETYFWAILRGKKYWEDNIMQTFHNCFLFAHHNCLSRKSIYSNSN